MATAVTTVTYAYPDVASDARAELATRLATLEGPDDMFLLATCLRIEMAVPGEKDDLEDRLERIFGSVPPGGLVRSGSDAVHHLFRVAAGLESPIVGEQEVWTQFRRAVASSKQGALPGRFTKLLEHAIATGRSARERIPSSVHRSLAGIAAEQVADAAEVAILGAGMMAHAAASALLERPQPPRVVMVARRPESVDLSEVEIWPFDLAEEAVRRFPAVISATSAKQRLVADTRLADVLAQRQEPLTLVDLAMPPDFRPPADVPVRYLAIDELADMVSERISTQDADQHVEETAAEIWRRYESHGDVGPVIARLYATGDELVEEMVDRFAGRLTDPGDEPVLRQTVHTAIRTLLAGPVEFLNRSERQGDAVEMLNEAFGLDRGDGGLEASDG